MKYVQAVRRKLNYELALYMLWRKWGNWSVWDQESRYCFHPEPFQFQYIYLQAHGIFFHFPVQIWSANHLCYFLVPAAVCSSPNVFPSCVKLTKQTYLFFIGNLQLDQNMMPFDSCSVHHWLSTFISSVQFLITRLHSAGVKRGVGPLALGVWSSIFIAATPSYTLNLLLSASYTMVGFLWKT